MPAGITRITIEGYKSIVKEQSIEIAPLTILAGANSSGKSSMIQPLLLLKQTLEAPFDPGPLLINGPILKYTFSDQFLSRNARAMQISFEAFGGRMTARFVKGRQGLGLANGNLPQSSPLLAREVGRMIHVPGLRGNPERAYPIAAVGDRFPGVFEHYVASIIEHWQIVSEEEALADINHDLDHLDLNSGILAVRINDAQLELRVKRTKGAKDLVNIVDVGLGVSQAISFLVALRIAGAGQLVYVEEPEQNLHPRAQARLADILAVAAIRGVRVIVETHSSPLLTAIQTLVAKGELAPDLVRLNWFQRNARTGSTRVTCATLDENGAFGDWPEDFGDVGLSTDKDYLDAVESRIAG